MLEHGVDAPGREEPRAAAGFGDVTVRTEVRSRPYASTREMLRELRGMGALAARQVQERGRLVEAVRAFDRAGGPAVVEFHVTRLAARRR